MKKLFAVFAMVLSLNVAAATSTVDVSKLTAEQRAQVQQIVEQKATEAPGATVDAVLTRIEKFGAGAARGLVGFAREIGAEVGNFAQTPLGMVVTAFTILHFFGSEITSLIVGVMFLFILAPIMLTLFIKSFREGYDCTYEYKPVMFGLHQKQFIVKRETKYMSESAQTKTFVLGAATVLCTVIGAVNFVI